MLRSVSVLSVAPPPGHFGAQGPELPTAVLRVLRDQGLDVTEATCADRDSLLRSANECASKSGIAVVVVVGHGKTAPRSGEEHSYLLTGDTELHELSATAVDVEEFLRVVSKGRRDPMVVVLDACEVKARRTLDATPAPLAVLLAAPGQRAEVGTFGPVLSRAFLSVLSRTAHARTWNAAFGEALEATRQGTSRRQMPQLVQSGSEEAWRYSIHAAADPPGFEVRLIELCNRGEFSHTHVEALLREPRMLPPGLEVSLLAQRLLTTDAAAPHFDERRVELERLTARHADGLDMATKASALHAIGWALWKQGDIDRLSEAGGELNKALRCLASPEWDGLRARILNTLGYVLREQRAFPLAAARFGESLALKERLGDAIGAEMSRIALAWLEVARGHFTEGGAAFRSNFDRLWSELERVGEDRRVSLEAVLRSTVLNAIGILTTCILLGDSPKALRREAAQRRVVLERCRPFQRWRRDPYFTELSDLLDLLEFGTRSIESAPWKDVALSLREGAQALASVEASWTRSLPSMPLDWKMKALAGATLLCQRLASTTPRHLMERLTQRLREDGYDAIRSAHILRSSLRLDTSEFPEWGPLGGKLEAIRRPDAYHDTHTLEKYLQLLVWCQALLMAMEGQQRRRAIYEAIRLVCPEGDARVNLPQMLGIAHRVAQVSSPKSDWGRALKAMWVEDGWFKSAGYESRAAIGSERNEHTHNAVGTEQATLRLVDRQQRLIRALAAPLAHADLPKWRAEGAVRAHQGEAAGQILSVVLVDTRGNCWDAGALLMARVDHPGVLYVPHILARNPRKTASSFYCSSPTTIDGQGELRFKYDDPESGPTPVD